MPVKECIANCGIRREHTYLCIFHPPIDIYMPYNYYITNIKSHYLISLAMHYIFIIYEYSIH